MNHHNKIWTFMFEFHICSISPLHSKDFQLLWASYIGLHKLRTTYAFPLFINLSLVKYWRQKKSYWMQKHRIYLLASYNQWMHTCMEQEMTLKKIFGCISIVKYIFWYMFFTPVNWWNAIMRHLSWYALFVKVKKGLRTKNIIFSSRRKR